MYTPVLIYASYKVERRNAHVHVSYFVDHCQYK